MTGHVITPAVFPADADTVRRLFSDYAAGLGIDLCFQDFAGELAGLPGKYARPGGTVLLARDGAGTAQGCVAMRPLPSLGNACEMKRMYLAPMARGQGTGQALALAIMAAARAAGYRLMVLDTLSDLTAAVALYRRLGFAEAPPYYDNPVPGVLYLACPL